MSVLYDQMTLIPFKTNIKNSQTCGLKISNSSPFLMNLNTKFERPFFELTSHNTSMCSVVPTLHQLKIL